MLQLIWTASAHTRYYLRRYMPTNIALDAIRTRRGLKWGVPAMLLAAPYLYAASVCTTLIDNGGPGWLHILVLLFVWNAFKMLWIARSAWSCSSEPAPSSGGRGLDTPPLTLRKQPATLPR